MQFTSSKIFKQLSFKKDTSKIFPPFMNVNAGKPFVAHIERVYRMEISQSFKIAHRLSQKAFHLTNIEETTVKL